MRITRDEMLMVMAHTASLRGTCNRLRVGAVLCHQNRPISIGYNGAPPGQDHCDNDCGPGKPCTNTVHAEENALSWCRTFGIDPTGSTIYVTDSPCINCAKMIYMAGVVRVVYDREYRDSAGVDYLREKGVGVCQVSVATSVNFVNTHTTQE